MGLLFEICTPLMSLFEIVDEINGFNCLLLVNLRILLRAARVVS